MLQRVIRGYQMSSNIRLSKVCLLCNEEFVAKTTVTKYCGQSCAGKAYKKRKKEEKTKKAKNNEFYRTNNIDADSLSSKEFLSITETCLLLGISRMSLHRYIKKGLIPSKKIGSRVIISREQINSIFKN